MLTKSHDLISLAEIQRADIIKRLGHHRSVDLPDLLVLDQTVQCTTKGQKYHQKSYLGNFLVEAWEADFQVLVSSTYKLYSLLLTKCHLGFETGPQFVFNMGGPGIRVTQFGGPQPRRRPRPGEPEPPQQSFGSMITSLLPIILLFLLPLLSTLFSGSGSVGPSFTIDKSTPPYTKGLKTRDLKVPYWVDPSEYKDLSRRQKESLDHRVEVRLVSDLNHQCGQERNMRDQLIIEAQGWFSTDERKMAKARGMKLKSCERLEELKNRA
jgi:Domain of unknown function (DUF1977)